MTTLGGDFELATSGVGGEPMRPIRRIRYNKATHALECSRDSHGDNWELITEFDSIDKATEFTVENPQ